MGLERRDIYRADPKVLFLAVAAGVASGTVTFRVKMPGAFVRCYVGILVVGAANPGACTAWIAYRVQGSDGVLRPVTNRHGTSAAPASIFGDAAMRGVAYEVETGADDVYASVVLTTPAGMVAGDSIQAIARIDRPPAMCDEEWKKACEDLQIIPDPTIRVTV